MKLHLKFRHFDRRTIAATEAFFDSHPWHGESDEQQIKFERWLEAASRVYRVPKPTMIVQPEIQLLGLLGTYDSERGVILMRTYSATTMFHEFRHHLQQHGHGDTNDETDALGWACSLFYRVRPRAFRKAVRAGRIVGVEPQDLLRSITSVDEFLTDVLGEAVETAQDEAPADEAEAS